MDSEKLRELIKALEAERDAMIQQVNARIAFLNGKIEALTELMDKEEDSEPES
jgi:hypothetical protein